MAKVIEQLESGLTIGRVRLGERSGVTGSVRQQVHDGDTINVHGDGNFGVRFLGVDAPEISFPLPGGRRFIGLADPRWQAFLADPFAAALSPFHPPLDSALEQHLRGQVGQGAALNHHRHAAAAEDALEAEVQHDIVALSQSTTTFQFFMAFAHEVLDRYGRFLCYINRDQPDPDVPKPRPRSYNERLLAAAVVSPYFIWPNINPFRRQDAIVDAVIEPGQANTIVEQEPALRDARAAMRRAREQQRGVFAQDDPLRLQPFEVRFLARRQPPDRWVINLSQNDNLLLHPQAYHTVANVEDRLFIPAEYVPLFVERGWRRQTN